MSDKKFVKYCQSCGREQVYSNNSCLRRALRNNSPCIPCRNIINGKKHLVETGYRDIPLYWFNAKKKSAEAKGREFTIDIEYIWRMYLKQKKVCALSGLPLDFNKQTENGIVSIDRIDNNKGYVKGNVQLLHKDVNYMKWTYEQEYFIHLCKLIINNKS
jgi:hypothetical protein